MRSLEGKGCGQVYVSVKSLPAVATQFSGRRPKTSYLIVVKIVPEFAGGGSAKLAWCSGVTSQERCRTIIEEQAMNPGKNRRRRLFKTAKLASGKRARAQQPPPSVPRILTGSDIERLVQAEQVQVARIIKDVVNLLQFGPSEASKAALRQRMGKLSPAARITARVLTRLQLDSRYGNTS